MSNELLLSPDTNHESFESMKLDFVNMIRHCCGEAKVTSIGIGVEDLEEGLVEITLIPSTMKTH